MLTRADARAALRACSLANTLHFSLAGLTVMAKVIDVMDGDTVKAAFDIGTGLHWHHVRLAGIDAPELRAKNEREREAAARARDHLASLIGDKIVTIKLGAADKYGRVLGTIIVGDADVNRAMVAGGYARDYDGGKREPWV